MALIFNAAGNYTLGRGRVLFATFASGQTPGPWRYLGNTPEFNLTIEEETLDHFSSDDGIREKDDSVSLEVTRTGTFICDDIQADNIALFFFGSKTTITQASQSGQSENFSAVNQGEILQIGYTSAAPFGSRALSALTVTGTGGTPTYVLDTDYAVDLDRGLIQIISGGGIADGTDIEVNFTIDAFTSDRVVSGSSPITGAMQYLANNPKGKNRDVFMPNVTITPNGDLPLKGDEWQQIPFSLEVLKPTTGEAIYFNDVR